MIQAAIIRWAAILVAFLLLAGYAFWQRGSKEAAYSALDTAQAEAGSLRSELDLEQERRDTEGAIGEGQGKATTDADNREAAIKDDYDERIEAAIAGRDRDNERLRQQWGQCITANLSAGAAAAGEAGEQDRLRRADIASVLRDAGLAQSERDEAVDLYQAVWSATNAQP